LGTILPVKIATFELDFSPPRYVVGVLLSGVFFAFKVTRLMDVAVAYDEASDTRLYDVTGQVFFASADIFADRFDVADTARGARIDLTRAHLWDITAVGALEDVVSKMRRHDIAVEVIGLNAASATLVDRHAPLLREPALYGVAARAVHRHRPSRPASVAVAVELLDDVPAFLCGLDEGED